MPRLRATGCARGGGSGAASSHSGRRFQTRSASLDGAASGRPQRGRHERCPAPAGLAHPRRKPRGVAVQRSVAALREPVQQGGGQFRQQRGLGFQAAVRRFEIEREGEAARRRRGGAGGEYEGEQLQQIECRHAAQAEAAERRRARAPAAAAAGPQLGGGLGRRQQQQFAVGGQDRGTAVAGDNGRRVGQGNARHGHLAAEITTFHYPQSADSAIADGRDHESVSQEFLPQTIRHPDRSATERDAGHEQDDRNIGSGGGRPPGDQRMLHAQYDQCRGAEAVGTDRNEPRRRWGWRRRRRRRWWVLMQCSPSHASRSSFWFSHAPPAPLNPRPHFTPMTSGGGNDGGGGGGIGGSGGM